MTADPFASAQAPDQALVGTPSANPVPAAAPGTPGPQYTPMQQAQAMEEVIDFSAYEELPMLDDGWYLLYFDNNPQSPGILPYETSKSGNPMAVFKPRVICDIKGDTSISGRFAPMTNCVKSGKGTFQLAKVLKQAFGIAVPQKSQLPVNWSSLLGRRAWGRVAFQKDSTQYKEVAEWRTEDSPPPGAVVPSGMSNSPPAAPTGSGIADRI